ncbi:MAG: hypothetical protein OEW84_05460 [Aigarchaeota archaeon]|nr:hypothetical protein [Aigarchaeota archaeon]
MSRFEPQLLGFLGRIEIDANVSLTFKQKVLAAICWGCLVGNHIAYLFRTALATQSGFNLETTIGVEVYITVAAVICWRALTKRSSQ